MKIILNGWKRYSHLILLDLLVLGMIDSRILLIFIICMIGPVIFSGLGRFWCGNICPIGNFFDKFISRFSNNKKVPTFFKSKYFRTIIAGGMLFMFAMDVKSNIGNIYGSGRIFLRMIGESIVIGTILSLLFNNYRIWCHFCPMGSMGSLFSYYRKDKKLLKVSKECVECKVCVEKCPMGVHPYNYKGIELNDTNCIQCCKCMKSCPKKSIGY